MNTRDDRCAGLLKIGQLAEATAKTIRALHLYEERDLLRPAQRSEGGFRLYNQQNVDRIRYIDRLQKLGYSLNEIRELQEEWEASDSPRAAMNGLAAVYRTRLADVRQTISELRTLEGELVESLQFIEGCHGCPEPGQPSTACGCCTRPESESLESPLITGLARH